jgi:hypothetical protein
LFPLSHGLQDQPFNPLRRMVNREAYYDLEEFAGQRVCAREAGAFRPPSPASLIGWVIQVLDWSGFFQPYLVSHLHGHTDVLGLQFVRDPAGGSVFRYKDRPALDAHWRGQDATIDGPLVRVLLTAPRGRPSLLAAPICTSDELKACLEGYLQLATDEASKVWLRALVLRGQIQGLTMQPFEDGGVGLRGQIRVGQRAREIRVLADFPDHLFSLGVVQSQAVGMTLGPDVLSQSSFIATQVSNAPLSAFRSKSRA